MTPLSLATALITAEQSGGLLPCPFCGHGDSPAIDWFQCDRDANMVTATCRSCAAQAPPVRALLAETGMKAAGGASWNRRQPSLARHLVRAVELLTKLRTHSSRVNADGDHYAAFNHRYLDDIDAFLASLERETP